MNPYDTQDIDHDTKDCPEIEAKVRQLITQAKAVGTIPSAIDGGILLSSKHITPAERQFCTVLEKSAARAASESGDPSWRRVARIFRSLATGSSYRTKTEPETLNGK
jgi:hypothetical protein